MYTNLKGKKVLLYTLGCKVNQYESDAMLEALLEAGCTRHEEGETADICIINTCSVTNMADRKSRQMINRLRKQNPNAIIAATGCYVQIAGDSLLDNGLIDLVIGNNRKKDVVRLLDEYISTGTVNDNYIDVNKDPEYENLSIEKPETHTRAYVKIQDGCNEFCSYCIIPYARGRIKSKKLIDITAEVDTLAKNGTKEIILTGINVSAYEDSGLGLKDVIKRLSKIDGIERIRLSSMDPRIVTKDFLDTVSKLPNFCPHFHLSLQSACNKTLKAMNRKYTIEEYKAACELIRSYFDRPAITTDIIVGFPGETDADFEDTYKNLVELNLYEMHVFKYSRRKGTVADKMPDQVDEQIKTERSNRLLELSAKNKAAFEKLFEGEKQDVLIEELVTIRNKKYYRGHTMRYVLIDIPESDLPTLKDGQSYINKIV
ncbi:MAG: tRNA (N(6)-L-threonylcarbamoyladenosine(37)-C(2))-methylthiotransferase MtaB [Eubacterium sp.]|nr:tRNA (N(6)-L-threonylcarbamoyladenosine(37)-C(2))-methylthiotransferase MtaB [Eubacterium sp.]